jgi:hypothetical protein
LRASATGKLQICATADQNDVAPALVQKTSQVNGRGAAANDSDASPRENREITMVETVRYEPVWKRAQALGHVSERTNADCDDDTASPQLAAVIKVYDKFVAAALNRTDFDFRQPRRATLLKIETVVTENIESNRLRFPVRDRLFF